MPYTSLTLRRRVMRAAGNRCEYCQAAQEMTLATFYLDHIILRSAGRVLPAVLLSLRTFV